MEANKFGYWLQIGANVGILAGLILVALQMKQNSDLLAAQLIHQESDRYIAVETAALGEDLASVWAKALESPDSLTLKEQINVESYIFTGIERWRSLYRLSEQGLLSGSWETIVREDTSYFLAHPYGRSWWQTYTSDPNIDYPVAIVSLVDEVLENTPGNDVLRYFRDMKAGIPADE